MGFDIKIVPKKRRDSDTGSDAGSDDDSGEGYGDYFSHKDDVLATAYLSYNWSDMSEICANHEHKYGGCTDECEKIHLWYIRDDLSGKTGGEVADNCFRALKLLAERGIYPRKGHESNSSWGWGVCEGPDGKSTTMHPWERTRIFAWHLKNFLKLGLQYYDDIFLND